MREGLFLENMGIAQVSVHAYMDSSLETVSREMKGYYATNLPE